MDLGDRTSRYCVIEGNGEVVSEGSVATMRIAMREKVRRSGALPDFVGSGAALAMGESASLRYRERCGGFGCRKLAAA